MQSQGTTPGSVSPRSSQAGAGARTAPVRSGSSWSARSLVPRYEAYRRHQVRAFLSMLPPEGLRGLYRAARDPGTAPGSATSGGVTDPVALLEEYVRARLPLPPFHVWYHDVRVNAPEHLDEPWMADALPASGAPLAISVRQELLQGQLWQVELRVHHTAEGWRGHLDFASDAASRSWQSGDVIREATVRAVVERFEEFDRLTLEAFLRSVLP